MSETLTKPVADTAKADDYLRSLGLDPAEIRQQQGEAELFKRFPPDFNTFTDASSGPSLTPDERKQLDGAMTAMLERAGKLKQAMLDAGKEPDLDKIEQEVFGHIPRNFVPPQFKKELQDWRITRDAMNDRNVQKMMEAQPGLTKEILEKAPDVLSTVATIGKMGAQAGEVVKVFSKEKAELLSTIFSVTSSGAEMIGTTRETGEVASENMNEESSVKQKMADDKIIDGFSKLADAGLDIAGEFVPVFGAVQGAKATMQSVKDAAERIMLRGATGELQDKAKLRVASQLSKALEQAATRETRLAAEQGVGVVSNAIGTAGSIATSTVVGAKVGAALTITGKVISVGSTVVFKGIDWSAAEKAVDTLTKARAGDEASQQEVFKNHAHYAKMLIAILAKQEPPDPIAVQYLVDRGLTETEIGDDKNSREILLDYALFKSGETDEPTTFLMDIQAKLDLLSSAAGKVRDGAAKVGKWLGILKDKPHEEPPSFPRVYSVEELRQMRATLEQAKKSVKEMQNSGKEIPKWVTSNVTNVEAAIAAAANSIREQYVSVMTHQAEWDQVANGFKRPGHEGTREIAAAKVEACRSQGAELRELYAAAMG